MRRHRRTQTATAARCDALARNTCPRNRRGLAPLEFVLSLPLLLFVMGLMIIIGTAGAWKVRTHAVAREALWRELAPRNRRLAFAPLGWPRTAEQGSRDLEEELVPFDPLAHHQVVRGPVLTEPKTGRYLPVDEDLLPLNEGTRMGFARLERGFPVLGRVPPHGFTFAREPIVFDSTQWRYWEMGLASNFDHRIPVIYPFDFRAVGGDLTQRYTATARAVAQASQQSALDVLDRDYELYQFFHRYFDFHPAVPVDYFCSADPDFLQSEVVFPLVIRISGGIPRIPGQGDVAETMTDRFLSMYYMAKAIIENPRTPEWRRRQVRRIVGPYESKIKELEEFREYLSR